MAFIPVTDYTVKKHINRDLHGYCLIWTGEAKKVWLSYEPENNRAREIYQKYGFVENGEMCGNEIVAVYEL